MTQLMGHRFTTCDQGGRAFYKKGEHGRKNDSLGGTKKLSPFVLVITDNKTCEEFEVIKYTRQ